MSKSRLFGAVALVVALSGCAGVGLHPGAAVVAGDETIPMSRVDELAGEYCEAITDQLVSGAQVLPQRFLRGGIAGILALQHIGDDLAAEYGVEPGPTYDQKVSALQQSTEALDEDVREAVILVEASNTYMSSMQASLGQALLREEGVTGATYDEQVARGAQAFEDWIADHGVEFDPSLGVTLKNATAVPTDDSLSVPVGELAQQGTGEGAPDEAYSRGLPDAQRCG